MNIPVKFNHQIVGTGSVQPYQAAQLARLYAIWGANGSVITNSSTTYTTTFTYGQPGALTWDEVIGVYEKLIAGWDGPKSPTHLVAPEGYAWMGSEMIIDGDLYEVLYLDVPTFLLAYDPRPGAKRRVAPDPTLTNSPYITTTTATTSGSTGWYASTWPSTSTNTITYFGTPPTGKTLSNGFSLRPTVSAFNKKNKQRGAR